MSAEPPEGSFLSKSYSRPGRGGRAVLFAGVAGACVLGVGAGLWARPAIQERQAAAAQPDAVAAPAVTARKLQIVVDDRPPPAGAPIEVLPAGGAAPAAAVAPLPPSLARLAPLAPPVVTPVAPPAAVRAQAENPPAAPSRPLIPPGLIKAVAPMISHAIAGASLAIARAEAPPAVTAAAPAAEPVRLTKAEPAPEPVAKPAHRTPPPTRAQAASHATADKVRLARLQAAKAHAAKLQLAKAQAQKAAARRLELAEAAKAAKAEKLALAEAEARGRAEAREEARQEALADARKRARLAALAHVLARALPHRARPEPDPEPVQVAKAGSRHRHPAAHEPRVEQASLKTRHAHEAARPAQSRPARAHPQPVAPQPGSGLMKVSTSPRCANRDPGEALVCADPSLGAADRQLLRAYQGARAAGVPEAQLRGDQQRWLAARSSAAREAPWAVRDVYMARIAELNGQAKDARDGY